MAEANNAQVQEWANQRTRRRAETIRNLAASLADDNGAIGSVYERLTGSGGWIDDRSDGPPNLLTGSDILSINTISVELAKLLGGGTYANDAERASAVAAIQGQLPIVTKACVRQVREG